MSILENDFLPRYLGLTITDNQSVEYTLICFCDASMKAYALTIYLHQASGNKGKADLLSSKTLKR